ncbi:hypothetical protein MPSEU_000015500 [Mayamaea pseudoterrestris]|nr:hypothetical protein MPSEU_000015500 [Mayamaea pseudoterrestris]
MYTVSQLKEMDRRYLAAKNRTPNEAAWLANNANYQRAYLNEGERMRQQWHLYPPPPFNIANLPPLPPHRPNNMPPAYSPYSAPNSAPNTNAETKRLNTRVNKLAAANAGLEAESKELKAEMKELKAEMKELKAEMKELKAEMKCMNARLVHLEAN